MFNYTLVRVPVENLDSVHIYIKTVGQVSIHVIRPTPGNNLNVTYAVCKPIKNTLEVHHLVYGFNTF